MPRRPAVAKLSDMTTDVLEPLRRSPHFPSLATAAWEELQRERAAREKFRDEILPHEKGEFINGQTIMHSPARLNHTKATTNLASLLSAWVLRHGLGQVLVEKAMIQAERNDYEPDVCFFRAEVAGEFKPDQCYFPIPDFIAEVLSPSTEARDRGVKFRDYAANGVREYWLVDADTETVEQYVLLPAEETYLLREKKCDGALASTAVAGFTLDVRAIFHPAVAVAELRRLLA